VSSLIQGFATPEGTAAFRARASGAVAGHWRVLRGLELSSVGLGTYLGPDDDEGDRAYEGAVARALACGINVLDTAINYRHQRSERAIGSALAAAVAAGRVSRQGVVLATKGGFLPFDGGAPTSPGAYLTDTYVRAGVVAARDVVGGGHAMTPGFLADQLDRSRANLGVATIDVYYVHNPEVQLAHVDRDTFRTRLRAAFEALEASVGAGKVRCYGVATWQGLRRPAQEKDHLSLAELVGLAREVAGERHHFAVVQLPYNLGMTEAFTLANQQVEGEALSLLQAAERLGVYVMASASIHQGQLARNLPAVIHEFLPGLATDAQRAIQFVRSTPGVGTALVGMRTAAHVEENASLARTPPLPWEDFRRLFSEG
jgi:aryl-alcohol dehydrogenase-like predicted oxidoreductase